MADETLKTFDAANKWLASRVNVPTTLSSRELSLSPEFSAKVKAHAFFSAKVAEAHILDRIRSVSDRFSRGEMNLATARTELKKFLGGADDVAAVNTPPDGMTEAEWKARKRITNLASTARLNLILKQNAAMAAAVGQREVSLDPDILERWPYFRYMKSGRPNARPSHVRLDGLVLKKTDPFWNTHTPPWDYNCQCMIEDCDDDEANDFGGVDKAVIDPETGEAKLSVNGMPVNIGPNQSGYEFDIRAAFETFDAERIKNIDLRRAAIEEGETRFGDQLSRTGNLLEFTAKNYQTWEAFGLKSAKTWQPLPIPSEINPEQARTMLESGVTLTAPDKTVTLGQAVLDHWENDKGASEKEINSRLKRINTAIETIKNPAERWLQENQSRYLQVFRKTSGGVEGCLVAVTDDGQARTYFIRSVQGINNARNGLSFEEF